VIECERVSRPGLLEGHVEVEDVFEHQGEFVLCDLRAEAKETVKHRAYNTTQRSQMAARG
jgi:hypothetical protein